MTAPPGPEGAQNARLNALFFRRDPLGFLKHLSDTFGAVSRFDLGGRPVVFVHDANLVRALFRAHEMDLRKPDFLRESNIGHWGDGLTTLDDPEIWRNRRQNLRHIFRSDLRVSRVSIAAEFARSMVSAWADEKPIDLMHEMRLLTARIAARTVLDADLEGYGDGKGRSGLVPYLEGYGEDFTTGADGSYGPVKMTRPRAPHTMDGVLSIVRARFGDYADRGDVLSALVRAHREAPEVLSEEDVLGEVIQMLYAGHLTIPFALTRFWRDIASYSLQRQLADGASAHMPAEGRSAGSCRGGRLTAMLKESMRMTPPAPILYREVAHSFALHGYQMPVGHGIWVSPGLLHRDPRYFSQPSEFLSDRFAEGRLPPVSAKVYMPFGVGPRVCIAAAQSLSQMVSIIAAVAREYTLDPVDEGTNQFIARRRSTT